jgi:predicted nucleotidyltransferase
MMTLESGLEIPTEKIADICRRYGIQEMAIFGSAARGDMRPDSDVDVMVEFAPGVVHGWEYFHLEEELAEAFGRRIDMATKKWLKPHIKQEILREARVVYEA